MLKRRRRRRAGRFRSATDQSLREPEGDCLIEAWAYRLDSVAQRLADVRLLEVRVCLQDLCGGYAVLGNVLPKTVVLAPVPNPSGKPSTRRVDQPGELLRASVPNVSAQPAMGWIGIQARVPE